MASNNYAQEITDRIEAEQVLATFEQLAAQGRTFKALEFDPHTDRFAISLGRESKLPPFPEVEGCGEIRDSEAAKAIWSGGDTVQPVSFGNGLLGLLCKCDGRHWMLIPADSAISHPSDSSNPLHCQASQQCQFGFVLGGSDCDRPGTDTLRASWFYYPDPDWSVPLCPEHKSAILAMRCERWLNDSTFDAHSEEVDRSRVCGAPAVGLISWDCESNHDDECHEIACPGYDLLPACAICLQNPNLNDLKQREPK